MRASGGLRLDGSFGSVLESSRAALLSALQEILQSLDRGIRGE